MIEQANIRNFCIIAHIDHGKSTLADRFLELTGTVPKREMREQFLDQMDLEREKGITIKLQPVRMTYEIKNPKSEIRNPKQIQNPNDQNPKQPINSFEPLNFKFRNYLGFSASNLEFANSRFILNLIDTPGHVDFTYEVSRSLAAVEGVILLVDATQGIQAQTLANLYLAIEQNLTIIPVVNKIDLPNARIEETREELINFLGCKKEEIILASAKTGEGTEEILYRLIEKVPPPSGKTEGPLRALIFDSSFDKYKGVVVYVRIVDGQIRKGDKIRLLGAQKESEVLEIGIFKPRLTPQEELLAGEIGYVVTGFKEIRHSRVGDTIASLKIKNQKSPKESKLPTGQAKIKNVEEVEPLAGYKEIKPMVFAGLFPKEGIEFTHFREALEKLRLNDAALTFKPEKSSALGLGFRCGFLGLLHLEIVTERLKREYDIEPIVTVPSVAYRVYKRDGRCETIHSPLDLPQPSEISYIEEPIMDVDIITPKNYMGAIMELAQKARGRYKNTEYLSSSFKGEERVIFHYRLPLTSILVDFYDKLKSVSSGFASLNYEFAKYEKTQVARLDILVAEKNIEALSFIVYKDEAYKEARKIVKCLKEKLPRQLFEVKIQAATQGKIIAAEKLSAMRKDVTAKLYGGDVTRKKKLLKKQKKGKKRLKTFGKIDIPPEAFLAVLKR